MTRFLLVSVLFFNGFVWCMEEDKQLSFSTSNLNRSKKQYHHNPNMNTVHMLQAVSKNDKSIVSFYLTKGVNINAKDMYKVNETQIFKNMNALMVAVFCGHVEMTRFLINKNARLEGINEYGDTALIIAVRTGQVEIVEQLLNAGVNVYRQNKQGRTALQEACDSLLRRYSPSPEIQYRFDVIINWLYHAENCL